MAIFECTFKSQSLEKETDFCVIVPPSPETARVLYLLHGLSDNYKSWVRMTSIERYANEHNYFVVMPDGGRSFYTDMKYGLAYYTYISEELPNYIKQVFNVKTCRENTFIAGLSMGGYGAFKIALRNPDKYCAAAALSGAIDVCARFEFADWQKDVYLICGDKNIRGTDDDLFALLDRYSDSSLKKPRLYQACGTEDFLYRDNLTFKSKITPMGFDFRYEEGHGDHNWKFWDEYIKHALDFFDEK